MLSRSTTCICSVFAFNELTDDADDADDDKIVNSRRTQLWSVDWRTFSGNWTRQRSPWSRSTTVWKQITSARRSWSCRCDEVVTSLS